MAFSESDLYSSKQHRLEDVREFLFEKINVDIEGASERCPRVDALIQMTGVLSAYGNGAAEKDLLRLQDALQPRNIFGRIIRTPASLTKSKILQTKIRALVAFPTCIVYLNLIPEIEDVFCENYGESLRNKNLKPHFMGDLHEPLRQAEAAIKAQRRKEVRGKDYEVGRNKTPVPTRFQKNHKGNPTGRAKTQPSVLEAVTKALSGEVPFKKIDGTRLRVSHAYAAYLPVFNKALNGNARARREMFDLIASLYKEGLLAPELNDLRRAYKRSKSDLTLRLILEMQLVKWIKKEVVSLYANRYGPVDDFVTHYEFSLAEQVVQKATALDQQETRSNQPQGA